jgi:hypothetical protein
LRSLYGPTFDQAVAMLARMREVAQKAGSERANYPSTM